MMRNVLITGCLVVAVGCGPMPSGPTEPNGAPEGPFPLTVTDDLSRAVVIPRRPARIISLSPAITETLFAIGAGPQVVAVTTTDCFPPEATRLPTVGGFAPETISTESIVALRPDLVLAAGRFHSGLVETLSNFGVPVVAVDASSMDDVAKVTAVVGRATGHDAEAAKVNEDIRRRRDAVRQRAAVIANSQRPKVLYVLWDDPLMTVGPNTFIGQMIVEAGGVNIFADASQQYPRVSDEAVLERNPDLILLSDHGDSGIAARIGQRKSWNLLAAARHGRIHTINEDWVNRPGPRLIDGLESIEALIHQVK